jgi:cytochrome c biogenesis factor
MWGIHTHQFQWQYVFCYSSRDLSAFYLTSTFWAVQEGTFLLWLLMGSIYGLIIIKRKFKSESLLMGFLALVQVFIVMILVKKNPFSYVWNVNPNHFQSGMIPIDGNGLNPLLQDPWMIIHPPILFIGYEINEHELNNENMQIAVILNVSFAGQQHVLKPAIKVNSQKKELVPAKLPNAERDIFINKIDIEAESITLQVNNKLDQLQHAELGKELLAIELTEKPLINILWIGTILMIIGLEISMTNRLYGNRL